MQITTGDHDVLTAADLTKGGGMNTCEFGWWVPQDVEYTRGLEPGCLVAHDFRPWRLISVHDDEPRDDDPVNCLGARAKFVIFVLRPVDADPTVTAHSSDLLLRRRKNARLNRIREHYSLCVHCGELPPCREVTRERAYAAL
jgi:hypothetical protein